MIMLDYDYGIVCIVLRLSLRYSNMMMLWYYIGWLKDDSSYFYVLLEYHVM